MEDVRLVVGIPNSGLLKVDMVRGLLSLIGEVNRAFPINFIFHGGCYVHKNRETILKQALTYNFTHLMFIDTDMVFPAGAVLKLLEQRKPIIGANYNERRLPLKSTVKIADKKGNLIAMSEADFPKESFQCYAVATGFMMIDLAVVNTIPKPWFFFDTKDGEFNMGEDIWFCRQAQKAGVEVWCDPTITVGHIGEFVY
jgi:hypothetical protein